MSWWTKALADTRREYGDEAEVHIRRLGQLNEHRLAHAYLAGVDLRRRKQALGTGKPGRGNEGVPWLDGLSIGKSQASRLVQLADLMDNGGHQKLSHECDSFSGMGITEAIKALKPPSESKPRKPKQTVIDTEVTEKEPDPEPAPKKAEVPRLPRDLDDRLAEVQFQGFEKLLSLVRHDELWIDPERARKALARELVKTYERLQSLGR